LTDVLATGMAAGSPAFVDPLFSLLVILVSRELL